MKNFVLILCFVCLTVKNGNSLAIEESKSSELNENYNQAKEDKPIDLEGSETVGKLFNLKGLFPSYNSYPSYTPSRYPSSGSGYYPSSSGYYPSSSGGYYPSSSGGSYPSSSGSYYPSSSGSYYPSYKPYSGFWPSVNEGSNGFYPSTGTNILGHGSNSFPGQSYYPNSNSWYRTSGDYSSIGSSSNGGYGGYGGNGGLNSYSGYNNPRYYGKRNLGFGYQADTDRYGFYKSPSKELSVYRGYD